MPPRPYKVDVAEASIKDLKQRLALTKVPDQFTSDDIWEFGAPITEVKRLVDYWKDGFDWRGAEAQMNELPQFQT